MDRKETEEQGVLPEHIAVIMDGNGRWARSRGLPRTLGHRAGIKAVRQIVRECARRRIRLLTLYAFSAENWKRPRLEVEYLSMDASGDLGYVVALQRGTYRIAGSDSTRAGFTRVVFVIRRDFEAVFREKIGARYAGRVAVDYVFQSLDVLPPGATPPAGREKPWGTGHAVWCAREAIGENFAVINADEHVAHGKVVKVMDHTKQAGITRIAFGVVPGT